MVTICFKGGVCLEFPKDKVKRHIFNKEENYRLETVKDGKKVYVYFSGSDVLYVMEET